VQQAIRLLNEPEHYQSMARVCMPYGDGTAGEKTVQLLAGQP
jgi:UDP-N-acetylglucosamine 2-epimerase